MLVIFPGHKNNDAEASSSRATSRLRLPGKWWSLALTLALSAAGCSDDPATNDTKEPVDTGDDDADDDADDDGDEPPAKRDAGPLDASLGGRIDGSVVRDAAPRIDATSTPDSATNDAALPTIDAGPKSFDLPDPKERGPYEVTIEENVGKGFETPLNTNDRAGNNAYCEDFTAGFGDDPEASQMFAQIPAGLDMTLHTMLRPAEFEEGKKYPVLVWGNGTCALPRGQEAFLSHIASHGFIIIAPNTRFTGGGQAQLKAVDYAIMANDDPASPLYGKVDKDKIGAFGHSQGGGATWAAAADPRIKTSVVLNALGSGTRPSSTFFVTSDNDIPLVPELSLSSTRAQAKAAYIRFHKIPEGSLAGHITLITEPARVAPPVTAWFRYQLLNDEVAKTYFVGASCKLCNMTADFTFEAKGLQ